MTIWVALYGWAILRNEVSETLPTCSCGRSSRLAWCWRSLCSLASTFRTCQTPRMLWQPGVAADVPPPLALTPMTVATPYALHRQVQRPDASADAADIMKEASMFRLDLAASRLWSSRFGSVIFLCIALFVVTLAKVFLTFVVAIGPLFILCLAWRPTARFFDSWLSMVSQLCGADVVRLLRAGFEHLHGRGHVQANHRRRRLSRRIVQRSGRGLRATAC